MCIYIYVYIVFMCLFVLFFVSTYIHRERERQRERERERASERATASHCILCARGLLDSSANGFCKDSIMVSQGPAQVIRGFIVVNTLSCCLRVFN